jgi:Zn-dependent protease with chaperone function
MQRLFAALLLGFALAVGVSAAEPRPQPPLLVPDANAEWRGTAKRRTATSLSLRLADEAASAVVLAWLAFAGVAARMRDRLPARIRDRALGRAAFIVLVSGALFLVSLPFDLARFAVSRSYGIAQQTLGSWLGDHVLAFSFSVASALFLGMLFYSLLRRRPRTWWRWVTVAGLPFAVAAVLVAPLYIELFNTFSPVADRPLAESILALAGRSQIPASEVYVIDMSRQTRAPNAFVTGLGPTTTIALGDTLLENFRDDEVLFVTAHEMGHYVHSHLWMGVALAVLMTAAGAWLLQRLLLWTVARWRERLGYTELSDIASLPLVLLAVAVLTFAGNPVANIFSRWIEEDADRFALELTVPGDVSPEAAVSMFERLGQQALSDPAPNPVVRFLFWNHPTLDERVAVIRRWGRQEGHR